MRRCGTFLLAVLAVVCALVFPAAASAAQDEYIFEVVYEETAFTVNLVEQTIAYGDVVCRYEIVNNTGFKVIYPDGSYYLMEEAGVRDSASWSENYDPRTYVSGPDLWNVLGRRTNQTDDSVWKELIGWIFLVIGAVNVVAPKVWWQICYGWWAKERKPNDVMLNSSRVVGLIAVVIGVFMIRG